jgi:DNA-binding response OmpR family regulator
VTRGLIKTMMLFNSKEEASELNTHISKLDMKFDAIIARNMECFASIISTQQVECFILDWNYAHYSTANLIEQIRKSDKYGKTPIVVIIDKKDTGTISNVDLVIARPFNPQKINEAFAGMFDKKFLNIIPEDYDVLILDDNPDIVEIMVGHMQELKHTRFQTCGSIAEAKKLVTGHDFDLLLLDWDLGDGTCIDLIEFARSKKQNKRLTEALIMVITGRNDIDDIMTLLRYNVKDLIIRPFNYIEFEEKIIYALERHSKIFK